MSSIENIVKRLRESRITEAGIISISIDEDKLEAAMKKEGYGEEEFGEFLYDIYGLEDGEDFQTGNGYELLFYKDTGKDDKIEKLRKDIGEDINESEINDSFKVGDEVEWSGLYGGSYTGKITKITDKEVTLDVSWTSEDDGRLITKSSKYPIEKDSEGNDTIVVWEYHGHKGHIYPPSFVSESTHESQEYLSSFRKDVMREVNDKAPGALYWKNGDIVYNKANDYKAEFKGYKRDFLGKLKAILVDEYGEEVSYSLDDLDFDIKKGALINKSSKLKESAENFTRAEMIRIIKDDYKKNYNFDKLSDQQLYKIINRLEDEKSVKDAEKSIDDERARKLENTCEDCGSTLTDSGECPQCDLHLEEDISGPSDQWLQRDNSGYHKEMKKDEESHPYVGKKVMWKEDRKYYEVDRAYEGRDGIVVRCGNITMKPGEYVIEESSEVKDSEIKEIEVKIKDKVKEYMMTPEMGFPEDEVDDYSRVEVDSGVNDEGDKFIKVEVRAELGYVALSNLCDELNPVLSEYDKDSYFEPEQPGIIVAYLFI